MAELIDSHCHLDQLDNVEQVLKNAQAAGVWGIICVGTDLDSNRKNLELKRRFSEPKLFPALGIHPTEIETDKIASAMEFIRANIKEAVAIGEIGLDFWHKGVKKNPQQKTEQEEVFGCQLALARESNLPVSIHSRGAWQRCLKMLKEFGIKKAGFHWYSGPTDVLKEILDAGFFISVTPALSYSPQHQAALKAAPIERLFLETDSPVFFGDKGTGFSAEPRDVFKTLELVAKFKNMAEERIAEITTASARKFFNIQ